MKISKSALWLLKGCPVSVPKWCQIGFQGTLLSAFFLKPLIPHMIIMGGAKQASLDSLHRALFDRFEHSSLNIKLYKTQEDFDEKSSFRSFSIGKS